LLAVLLHSRTPGPLRPNTLRQSSCAFARSRCGIFRLCVTTPRRHFSLNGSRRYDASLKSPLCSCVSSTLPASS
jgi:hypothetical protein